MQIERLLEPLSESEPCGPDLDEIGDEDYLNYMLPAEERLPERYYDKLTGDPFDRGKIDLRAEVEAIARLLEKSRDIRLLCLEARFQSFVGQVPDFARCIGAIAALLERYWEAAHPQALDGDYTLRQNVVGALDDWLKVIQPLHHLPLVRDRRLGPLTFRQYSVATGASEPRQDEKKGDPGEFLQALGSEENRAAAQEASATLEGIRGALSRIRNAFIENAGYEYAPSFERLTGFLDEARRMFEAASPALAPAAPEPEAAATGDAATAEPSPDAAAAGGLIAGHADALAALAAAEAYFAAHEPTAPALLLARQARGLVGKTLVEAIEILLPEMADKAAIRFETEPKLQIAMPRIKALAAGGPPADAGPEEGRAFSAGTRAEASALLSAVEAYFRAAEPSSPIPMLLSRARSYANKDFAMILNDLLGK